MNKQEYLLHEISKEASRVAVAAQELQAMSDGSVSADQNKDRVKKLADAIDQLQATLEEAQSEVAGAVIPNTPEKETKKDFIRKTLTDIDAIKAGKK